MSSRATFFAILRVRPDNVANLHCKLSLLRARRERPGGRRAAEQRDELAPFHQQFLPCFEAEDSTAGNLLHCGITKEPLSAVDQGRESDLIILNAGDVLDNALAVFTGRVSLDQSSLASRLIASCLTRPNCDGRHCFFPVFPLEASVQRDKSWVPWTYTRSSFAAAAAGTSKTRASSRPAMPTKPHTK